MTKISEKRKKYKQVITKEKQEEQLIIANTIIDVTGNNNIFLPNELASMIANFRGTPFSLRDAFLAVKTGKNINDIVDEILQDDDILDSEAIKEFIKDTEKCMLDLEYEAYVVNSWIPYTKGVPISFIAFIWLFNITSLPLIISRSHESQCLLKFMFLAVYPPLFIITCVFALLESVIIAPPIRLGLIVKHSFFSSEKISDKYGLDDSFTIGDAMTYTKSILNEIEERTENANNHSNQLR